MQIHSSFEQAYYHSLSDIKKYGFATSPRGRASIEMLAYQFIITDPTKRIIGNPARDLNLYYAIGNFLWIMSQSNELDFISYYNPRGSMFSDDGKTLRGAYGKRIFDFDGMNQYFQAIRELKIDKDSRRAIISIHMPQHDWTGSLDTPCTSDFHLLIRDGKLTMINHMRSQSAAMVMPYDIFLMTMLQEYAAIELGVEVGEYIHICNSFHYFEAEQSMVDKLTDKLIETPQMEKMPKDTNKMVLQKLLGFEKNLRIASMRTKDDLVLDLIPAYWHNELIKLQLPHYWEQIGYILLHKAFNYNDQPKDANYIKERICSPFYDLLK